jgi:hypothetical protein
MHLPMRQGGVNEYGFFINAEKKRTESKETTHKAYLIPPWRR